MLEIKNTDSEKIMDSMKQIQRNMKNMKAGTVYLKNINAYQRAAQLSRV
jgi:hypothetical protein